MRAYVVKKVAEKEFSSGVEEVDMPELEEDEVLIKTEYSSLNYKDALSSIGNPGVTRVFPHITGIDVAGTIVETKDTNFHMGEEVVVTGYDLGMNSHGGHAQYVKVPSSWIVRVPEGLDLKEIMTYGTAGLTAALSINELLNNGIRDGKVLVTGATGGVGTIAVSILNKIGFEVTAISGKKEKIDFLKDIGAKEVILREDFDVHNKRPLGSEKYDALIDTVGGNILAEGLKILKYDGVATCCGLTSSPELNTNVFPFILRGVRLIGIDSVECTLHKKEAAWKKLANNFKIDTAKNLTTEIGLDEIKEAYEKLLAGESVGRYVVRVD